MKVLVASMPFDGHFAPLTGITVHLAERGHDVRFYTGPRYATKLAALGVPHFPFVRARDVNAENLVELFPEYPKLGHGPKAIEFALTQIFFSNLEAHLADLRALREEFAFDALLCDGAFYAGRLVAELLGVPVYAVYPGPAMETSKDVPPPFFGLKPARTLFGRARDRVVRALVERSTRSGRVLLNDLRSREGLPHYEGSIFDLYAGHARALFQIGAPSFDYPRRDPPPGFEYVGALLPHRAAPAPLALDDKLDKHPTLIVVSQGTVDNRDPEKLFVPALEALGGTEHLVVATTGGRNTEMLRRRFQHDNVVVEDFVDFHVLLPRASALVVNGGYGSVMLALANGVPIVGAGKLEGKIDINARVDYSGVGVDLRTERPTARRVAGAVRRVLQEPSYRDNARRIGRELASYRPFEIIASRLERDHAKSCSTSVEESHLTTSRSDQPRSAVND
jgi:MGT family glycosyltransferase